jgi:L-ascorbate metabolism protein UlaG (beta-lactamase superfamily)
MRLKGLIKTNRFFTWRRCGLVVLLACAVSAPLPADVTITQLANEGVIVTDGETRIMIDGMVVETYSIYGGLPPELAPLFEQASGPFSSVALALASHQHHDHNQPRFACKFLQSSATTDFASSAQVLGLMREKCRQFVTTSPRVREIDPQYGEAVHLEAGNAKVTVFLLSHGTRKYAKLQNFGHLLEIGGMRVLHIGDAAMDPTDFARAGLDQVEVDIALIPFWYFQPGPGMQVVDRFLDAPHKIAVHIPPGEMEEIKAYLSEEYPRVMILENTLDQARFSATAPPLP